MIFQFGKKRKECNECLKKVCETCFYVTRCSNCFTIAATNFEYQKIVNLPTRTLKLYVKDVVGMSSVDISRTLTEKSDFADKILQFKGIAGSKDEYYNKLSNERSSNRYIGNPTSENLMDLSSPVLRHISEAESLASPAKSSISSGSGSFQMFEDNSQDVEAVSVHSENIEFSSNLPRCNSDSEIFSNSEGINERKRKFHSSNIVGDEKDKKNEIFDTYDPEILRLKNYSVKELKNLLDASNVNYSGLIEKQGFFDKAARLVLDKRKNDEIYRSQTASAANLNSATPETEKDICKICWDATIDCVLLECGHMCTCTACAKKLNDCPICRDPVVRCVHVFRS